MMKTAHFLFLFGALLTVCTGCVSAIQLDKKLIQVREEQAETIVALRRQAGHLELQLLATREQLETALADEKRTREDEDERLAGMHLRGHRVLMDKLENDSAMMASELSVLHVAVLENATVRKHAIEEETLARARGDERVRADIARLEQSIGNCMDDEATARASAVSALQASMNEIEAGLFAEFASANTVHRFEYRALQEELACLEERWETRMLDEAHLRLAEDEYLFEQMAGDRAAARSRAAAVETNLDRLTADLAQEVMGIKTAMVDTRSAPGSPGKQGGMTMPQQPTRFPAPGAARIVQTPPRPADVFGPDCTVFDESKDAKLEPAADPVRVPEMTEAGP